MNILYVEDNFDNYKLVEFILSKNGFIVANAVDGLDALEKAEKYKPDLIIMDIDLPNLKGLEAATLIKSKENTKNIPIVVLTAAHNHEYKNIAETIGCLAYFTKPIDPISFPQDIKRILLNDSHGSKSIDHLATQLSRSLEQKAREAAHFNKEILKGERRFNVIVESSMDPIFIVDTNGIMTYANSCSLGYEFLRSFYKKKFDFSVLFKDDVENLLKLLNQVGYLKNFKFSIENTTFIGNFVLFDGEVMITLKDITEIENISQKQKDLDNISLVGRIASGIIHELNNPLSAMKTYIDIYPSKISKVNNKDEVVWEFANKLKTSLEKILELVNNLTFFARDKNEVKVKLNINTTIKELLSFSDYDIRKGNVNLKLEYKEPISLIYGVKSSIEQALLNLLLNANDAVRTSTNPQIVLKTDENDDFVIISIADSGPGIPFEIQKEIFEPFFSTKDDGKSTGLGLSIVKKVVLEHKGVIEFFTSENGTEFVLFFPKIKEENLDGKDQGI